MATMTVDEICDALREHQAQRVASVKAMVRLENQCRALARRALGWQWDSEAADRTKVNNRAAKLVSLLQAEEYDKVPAHDADAANQIKGYCLIIAKAKEPIEQFRVQREKDMRALVRKLPVWEFVAGNGMRGLAELGLAVIVGEVGNLSNYPTHGHLWKRMGLAVFEGRAQRRIAGDAEAAMAQGYNPRRRSAMWTIGDSALKAQGPYREMYLERKAYEKERNPEITKLWAHRRAQRYLEKRMLRDLWRLWRESAGSHAPSARAGVPASV